MIFDILLFIYFIPITKENFKSQRGFEWSNNQKAGFLPSGTMKETDF